MVSTTSFARRTMVTTTRRDLGGDSATRLRSLFLAQPGMSRPFLCEDQPLVLPPPSTDAIKGWPSTHERRPHTIAADPTASHLPPPNAP